MISSHYNVKQVTINVSLNFQTSQINSFIKVVHYYSFEQSSRNISITYLRVSNRRKITVKSLQSQYVKISQLVKLVSQYVSDQLDTQIGVINPRTYLVNNYVRRRSHILSKSIKLIKIVSQNQLLILQACFIISETRDQLNIWTKNFATNQTIIF